MTSTRTAIETLQSRMKLPVITAPMFLVSGPELVIAACKAGIMGAMPGPNARTTADLRQWFETITARVGPQDGPWAFNMITHTSYGRFDEEIALVEEFRPNLVITALGGPHRVTDTVHRYGGLVFADVNSPTYARKAIEKGADGLVLVCSGAGGHTGEYAMLPFIDEVRSFFDGPLIVGGGISTGRAVRAVENLGVDFAYVGTRFLAARETMISDEYRQMVIDSRMEDLIASRAITGALGNWMKASVARAGIALDAMKAEAKIDFSGDMHAGSKAWKHVWSAGQGVGVVAGLETVEDIVEQFVGSYLDAVEQEPQRSHFAVKNRQRAAA
ncbi:NAD(P)H-dependent flavin oxidoreductase [Rhizobium rhizoryzae]|uniref:NAD(P)H-dependent flavin oxidoreductase n=1 Tax=Rhizobium rhizoryzae TaxID=451876 RepID=UPI0028A23E42|nr:nitronate monooxygenase [Rhizobium rhizoryzae]